MIKLAEALLYTFVSWKEREDLLDKFEIENFKEFRFGKKHSFGDEFVFFEGIRSLVSENACYLFSFGIFLALMAGAAVLAGIVIWSVGPNLVPLAVIDARRDEPQRPVEEGATVSLGAARVRPRL